jgi:hypothetical protein
MFTGPDGVRYRWAMGTVWTKYCKASLSPTQPASSELTLNHGMKLVTADEKGTVIAEFHRPCHILKERKARIKVQPAGMEMLDYIVLTFVFAEKKRRERDAKVQKASSGGCG